MRRKLSSVSGIVEMATFAFFQLILSRISWFERSPKMQEIFLFASFLTLSGSKSITKICFLSFSKDFRKMLPILWHPKMIILFFDFDSYSILSLCSGNFSRGERMVESFEKIL